MLLSFALVLRTPGGSAPEVTSTDAVPPRRFHPVLGPLSVVILLLVALVGLTGKQVVSQNITPETFWVLTWIVVPLTCGLLGDWSRAVNPFANLARLAGRPRVRSMLLARRAPLEWRAG